MSKFFPIILSLLIFVLGGFFMYVLRRSKTYIFRTFIWGFCCALLAGLIIYLFDNQIKTCSTTNSQWVVIGCYITAALIEEIARLTAVIIGSHRDIKNYNDGLVYAFSASFGLALFENYIYVINYSVFSVLKNRLIFGTIGHLSLGVILGFFIARAKIFNKKREILFGLLITTTLHFLFNISGQVTYISLRYKNYFLFIAVIFSLVLLGRCKKNGI